MICHRCRRREAVDMLRVGPFILGVCDACLPGPSRPPAFRSPTKVVKGLARLVRRRERTARDWRRA